MQIDVSSEFLRKFEAAYAAHLAERFTAALRMLWQFSYTA